MESNLKWMYVRTESCEGMPFEKFIYNFRFNNKKVQEYKNGAWIDTNLPIPEQFYDPGKTRKDSRNKKDESCPNFLEMDDTPRDGLPAAEPFVISNESEKPLEYE